MGKLYTLLGVWLGFLLIHEGQAVTCYECTDITLDFTGSNYSQSHQDLLRDGMTANNTDSCDKTDTASLESLNQAECSGQCLTIETSGVVTNKMTQQSMKIQAFRRRCTELGQIPNEVRGKCSSDKDDIKSASEAILGSSFSFSTESGGLCYCDATMCNNGEKDWEATSGATILTGYYPLLMQLTLNLLRKYW